MRAPTHIEIPDKSGASALSVRRSVALRWHLRLALMFSALFHQASHFGFGPVDFWTCFRVGVMYMNPEMVFVPTYFIYRPSMNG